MATKAGKVKDLGALEDMFGDVGTSIDTIKEAKERGDRKGGGGGGNFYRVPPEKTTEIRILPSFDAHEKFYHVSEYHFMNDKYVFCRKMMDDDDNVCPICKHATKLWRKSEEGGSDSKKIAAEAKELFSTTIVLYNAVVRDDEKGDRVVVLQTGKGVRDEIVDLCLDSKTGDVTHATKGRDVGIKRTGKGKTTKYQVLSRSPSLLAGDAEDPQNAAKLISEILDSRKVLSELIDYPSEEEAQKELDKYLSQFNENSDDVVEDEEDSVEEDDNTDEEALSQIDEQIKAARKKRAG